MSFIWDILLIIIASLIVLGILFFIFIVWIFSKGLRNKFGPEWIPGELEISFNYFNVTLENKKTIRYSLSENETIKIADQICNLIIDSKINNDEYYLWRKSDNVTCEYRQMKNDKLKAILLLNSRELIYFK
jgi:hypothetical protein